MLYPGNRQLLTHHVTQPHADRVNVDPKPRGTDKPA